MSPALTAYRLLTGALEPLAPVLLRARAKRGKEAPERLGERLGRPDSPRPPGPLVWLHGASVGEGLSILPLVEALAAARPGLGLLATSGTVTSAALLAQRLPPPVRHQFVPVDGPAAAARFVGHWRPDLAVFVESEIWPNLLQAARAVGARTALVSARLSAASAAGWARTPAAARTLIGGYDLVLAQDDEQAGRLQAIGARDDGRLNLKLLGAPPPAEPEALEIVRGALGERPLLLAASTHPGEDELLLDVFTWLRDRAERPLLVIVPRHPVRGGEIADLARRRGFLVGRRGAGEPLDVAVQVYVADTLGELGLWFRLARAALIGGSLVEGIGGHNPLEPARLACPVISGPHVENWRAVYRDLQAADGVRMAAGTSGLAGAFAEALVDPAALTAEAERARRFAEGQAGALDRARDQLLALLDRHAPERAA